MDVCIPEQLRECLGLAQTIDYYIATPNHSPVLYIPKLPPIISSDMYCILPSGKTSLSGGAPSIHVPKRFFAYLMSFSFMHTWVYLEHPNGKKGKHKHLS